MRFFAARVFAVAFAASLVASAQSKGECVAAFDQGQVARDELRLRTARDRFMQCAQTACAPSIRKDCAEHLEEVLTALPSIVPGARLSTGEDLVDARVFVDGEAVQAGPGGTVRLDPGKHLVRFEHAGYAPVSQTIVLRVGERDRPVVATFVASAKPSERSSERTTTSSSPSRWVLAGVGVAGIGMFTGFAISGANERARLLDTCAPACPAADESRVKTRFLVADVSLLVGVIAGGVATYLFLQPSPETR